MLILSTAVAFLIPKQYESTARIMPPEGSMNAAMLAALSGRMLPGGLGALASGLMGVRNNSTVFASLLQSRTVTEHIVDRFDLQKLYWSRYKENAIKRLAARTDISEDRKTGIITVVVSDTDQRRARDMAQAYLDELNALVTKVNTTSAARERQFIEQRLISVKADLDDAQRQLSTFSSKNATLDVKEQTRAMVEATAKLEGELIVARTELSSLERIYGPENIRVRAAKARVTQLDQEVKRATGTPDSVGDSDTPYPPLRAIPALGVQWSDLYRRVKIQETVYELLTQQYELSRIEEAKSIPTVSIVDVPSWPEKKSFPPRLIIMLSGTLLGFLGSFLVVVRRSEWSGISEEDPRKALFRTVVTDLKADHPKWFKATNNNGHQH
jgi:capsule polysaccharide export protein KpsE/RkpR